MINSNFLILVISGEEEREMRLGRVDTALSCICNVFVL